MTSCQQIMTSFSYFEYMANSDQFGSRMDPSFVKLTFLLIVTFYFRKAENETKKFSTQLSYYCFEKRFYFCQKNTDFLLQGW